ncbi:MAG: MGMT family protein [Methanothrix sp.]|nr:MGMT family protein [Methanothrix sp.]
MSEGVYSEQIGLFLVIERYGDSVKRILFSKEPPDGPSPLAEGIVCHLTAGRPCPSARLHLVGLTRFQRSVFSAVQTIPRGQTRTYGEVAALVGCPGAARAVGRALSRNPFAVVVPCHRVVARQGLGGFSWGVDLKRRLLALEARL